MCGIAYEVPHTVRRTVHTVAYPRGIMPTDQELKLVKQLIERRDKARIQQRTTNDQLMLEVWRVRQRGVSARNLARAIGVGASTINDWTQAGKQLAQRGESH